MPSLHEYGFERGGGRRLVDEADRFCVQHRLLEGVRGAQIGLCRAFADGDADAGARDREAGRIRDFAGGSELVERRLGQQHGVERLAALDPGLQLRRCSKRDDKLVLGRFLELRTEVLHHRVERVAFEEFDLGGMGRSRRQRQPQYGNDGNRTMDFHGVLPSRRS